MASYKQFFFLTECPEPSCSHASFKKAGVWGYTVDDAKVRLVHHLTKSSYHSLSKAEATDMAENVAWELSGEHEEDEQQVPQCKRPRPSEPRPPAIPPDMSVRIEQALAPFGGPPVMGESVTIRRVEFQGIVDSVNRATVAVRQCQRLSAAASRAFADEASHLDSVKATLENILAQSEVADFGLERGL